MEKLHAISWMKMLMERLRNPFLIVTTKTPQRKGLLLWGCSVKMDFMLHDLHKGQNLLHTINFYSLKESISPSSLSPDSWDLWPQALQAFKLWLRGCWTDPWQMPLTPTGRHQQHNHLTLSCKCWVSVGKMKVRLCAAWQMQSERSLRDTEDTAEKSCLNSH